MIYIRVDSNPTIASGHVMRCLALAEAMRNHNLKVVFLVADNNPVQIIEKRDFVCINLNSNWNDLSQEIHQVKNILIQDKNSVLLIDSYQITKEYVESMKEVAKVCYLGSKRGYFGNLDAIINYSTKIDYNYYENVYANGTKLVLGKKYAPLRREFQNIEKHFNLKVQQVLLTSGNTDRDNIIPHIISNILPIIEERHIIINVIIGNMFQNIESLEKKYAGCPNIFFHYNVRSMSKLMKQSDMAISANGTTVYELAASYVPTITFAMVEEQVESAEELSRLGIVDYCGTSFMNRQKCLKQISSKLEYYCDNTLMRRKLADTAHEEISGNGCELIIYALKDILY